MKLVSFILSYFILSQLFAQEGFLDYIVRHPNQNFYETKAAMDAYYATRSKGKGSGYTHYMRWLMNTEPDVYPSGEMYNVSARMTATYERFKKEIPTSRATHGYWNFEGPTSYTQGNGWNGGNGRINCITIHPGASSVIYAGAPAGGLWKSTDAGLSWEARTDGLPSVGVSGIAVNYNNGTDIYILTGDGDALYTSSIGVLKSTDGGNTWLTTDLTFNITQNVRGYKLLMHPTNPSILFAATSNGLYKTVNGGLDWTQEHGAHITDVEFKPGTPAEMYMVSLTGFYRSSNTGDTWVLDMDTDFPFSWGRMAIGVSPANAAYVYLLFGGHIAGMGNGNFSGFYRSTDSGAEFSLRANTPNLLGYDVNGLDSANQATYDLSIAVDPANANIVYLGTVNIWKSLNGGLTGSWSIISHWNEMDNVIGYTHADIHALEFNGSTLFVGSDGGVYKSTNGGITWTNLSEGLGNMMFYYIDVESSVLTGGTQDNGTNQWTTSTEDATHSIGGDGFACLINYNDTDIRYQSDQDKKWRSEDGGETFTDISEGSTNYWGSDWIMDPADPDILFLAAGEVYRTTTGGTGSIPWTNMNSGFSGDRFIRSMAQGISNRNRLYATDDTLMRRSDNALASSPTWTDITNSLPTDQVFISDIAVDPVNSLRVWVTFYGFANGIKVYFSSNGGASWTNESGSLPNIPIQCIEFQPNSTNDALYIGTNFGVFYRNDVIGDWIFYSNGLPNTRVYDLDIEGSLLYAGTSGRGMWSSALYSCDINLTLTQANDPSGPLFTGHQEYHVSDAITSTRIITGGLGTDVRYNAAGSVTLLDGFHAKANNLLEVKLDGCPD